MKSLSNFIAESNQRVNESTNPNDLLDTLLSQVIPDNYDEESDPEGEILSEMTSFVSDQIEVFRQDLKSKKKLIPSYVALYYGVASRFYADHGFIPSILMDINTFVNEKADKFKLLDEPVEKVLLKNFDYGRGVAWGNIEEIIKSEDAEPETVKELLDFFDQELEQYI